MKRSLRWFVAISLVILLGACSPKQPPIFELIKLNQEGRHSETIQLAEKLLAENPDNTQAIRFLLRSAAKIGETENQKARYEQLVASNPDVAGYHFALGYIHTQLKDYEAAEEEFKKVSSINPSLEFTYYMLGYVYMHPDNPNRNVEAGLAEWRKEEQLNPESLGALQVYTNRANHYLQMNNAEAAIKDYEKITMYAFAQGDVEGARKRIEMLREIRDELARMEAEVNEKPDDPELRLQLGIVQYNNGKRVEAIESWQKAIELDPENPESRNYLGKALMEEKKFEEAIGHLRKAIELDPTRATVYYNLAVAAEINGDAATAIEHYKRYLELNPMTPKAREIEERLATLEQKVQGKTEG